MSSPQEVTTHKRVNVTLPADTLRLLDRVKEVGSANLKKQLRLGAIARASRDLAVAAP